MSNKGRIRKEYNFFFLAPNGNYRAYVYTDDGRVGLGTYKTIEDARAARDKYALHHQAIVYKYITPAKIKGHLHIALAHKGTKQNKYVHRLVAEAFIPNPNGYPVINHIDHDGENNDVSNLEWCTQKRNVQHSMHLMRHPKKSRLGRNKEKYIYDSNGKYVLYIRLAKLHYRKTFQTLEEAVEERDKQLRMVGYEV